MVNMFADNLRKKILFVSGSVGLGHVTRDVAIAEEIRKQNPRVDIYWLAGNPAKRVLREKGEYLVREAGEFYDESSSIERATRSFNMSPLKFAFHLQKAWKHNALVFKKTVENFSYDLVIGDEAYEVSLYLGYQPRVKFFPFVMIYDFIGLDATSSSPLEKIAVFLVNQSWVSRLIKKRVEDLTLFVGEPEDIPDKPFGWFLPNRQKVARAYCNFAGYVLPFDAGAFRGEEAKMAVRRTLGLKEKDPLIICSVGGTSTGGKLLKLSSKAFDLVRSHVPDAKMIMVGGPRFTGEKPLTEGIEFKDYVPHLYEYFAACDLAVVQGGGTTTLELTALKKPFLYFPLEGHFEQEILVERRLKRHRAGRRMKYSETTPKELAEKIIENLKCKDNNLSYAEVDTQGAKRIAMLINELWN